MKIYCCQEHVDWALDEIVYECETFPNLECIEVGDKLSTTCKYCRNDAIYVVGN